MPDDRGAAPLVFVIFGATGDLAQKKLIGALMDLYAKGFLPERCRIIGASRSLGSDEAFREFMRGVLKKERRGYAKRVVENFIGLGAYVQGSFDDPGTYAAIAVRLAAYDGAWGVCSSKLFYLGVPPDLYAVIFRELAHSGLSIPCSDSEGWTRVLVEKPFGNDLQTATELDRRLGALFREEQIFRIDHYLAKETVQNILAFRFSNALFEPIWNREHVTSIRVRLHESFGVDGRGNFYEATGALRDVGQNHVLQLLALATMEKPGVFSTEGIRRERARLLRSVAPITGHALSERVVRGQYRGYAAETGGADPKAETYFRIETEIGTERWRGVPCILESGKRMPETKTDIVITFKQRESCLCPPEADTEHHNTLTFRIQPDEGITVGFWVKRPGFTMELEPKSLSFSYKDSEELRALPDAYERVLYDCIRGDQTLFASTEEVEASWRFITPIIEAWGTLPLHVYEPEREIPRAG
jgi:glucose-6-phosphate 1-dehydrogenase